MVTALRNDDDNDDLVMGQSRSEPAVVDIDDPLLTSHHLNALVPGLTYRVSVCARTRVGCGHPVTVDLRTPPAGRTLYIKSFTLRPWPLNGMED